MTRRGRCAVNMEPGEGATAGEALKSAPRPPEGERAALEGAALAGVLSGMKSEALETRARASEETRGSDARADDGSAARASSDSNGTSGLSLTPNAANGSVFLVNTETGVAAGENAAGENAAIAASAAAAAGPAPKGDAGGSVGLETCVAGPGGGHVAVVAGAGGLGIDACCVRESVCEISAAVPLDASFSAASDGAPALGSGNAEESPSASRSSFWNSRTDSSADSTAKETLLDASDCLRFFRAASLRLASAPSTLLTSLKMLLLRRLRMEEGVARDSTFSLASEATGVVAGLEGVAAAGEGITFSACASAGGGAPLCRGERRRGSSEPAMAVRCVKAHQPRPRWDRCAS